MEVPAQDLGQGPAARVQEDARGRGQRQVDAGGVRRPRRVHEEPRDRREGLRHEDVLRAGGIARDSAVSLL